METAIFRPAGRRSLIARHGCKRAGEKGRIPVSIFVITNGGAAIAIRLRVQARRTFRPIASDVSTAAHFMVYRAVL